MQEIVWSVIVLLAVGLTFTAAVVFAILYYAAKE